MLSVDPNHRSSPKKMDSEQCSDAETVEFVVILEKMNICQCSYSLAHFAGEILTPTPRLSSLLPPTLIFHKEGRRDELVKQKTTFLYTLTPVENLTTSTSSPPPSERDGERWIPFKTE